MAAGNLVVVGTRLVDSPTVAGSHLADNLAAADNLLVVIHFLVDSPAVADSRLVV